jgi:hypothetical protein
MDRSNYIVHELSAISDQLSALENARLDRCRGRGLLHSERANKQCTTGRFLKLGAPILWGRAFSLPPGFRPACWGVA